MDENLRLKHVLTGNLDGIQNKMILMPYAKNLMYANGHLKFTLELFNDSSETEIGIDILVNQELQGLLESLIQERMV